jgi:hypothetical protein
MRVCTYFATQEGKNCGKLSRRGEKMRFTHAFLIFSTFDFLRL